MELYEIILTVVCFFSLTGSIKTAVQFNKLLDVVEKQNKRFYDLVNLCRDEGLETNRRVEAFEKSLETIMQNLALDPLFYNKLFAASNGTKQFTYEDLSHLMTNYNEYLAGKQKDNVNQ